MPPKIFCSINLLAKIFDNENNLQEFKKLPQVQLLKNLWYSKASFMIDDSNCQDDKLEHFKKIIEEPKQTKIIQDYDSVKVDFKPNHKDLLTEENINKFCNDIFIIDENEKICDLLIKKFGILVISEKTLNKLESIFFKYEIRVEKNVEIYGNGKNIKHGWNSLIINECKQNKDNLKLSPVNSIIINDCYIFENNYERGTQNIISLINSLMFHNTNKNAHITIFTCLGKLKLSIFEKIVSTLKKEFREANFEIFVHNNKTDLHARFIITNYSWIYDPHNTGFDVFNNEKSLKRGSVDIKNLFCDLNSLYGNEKLSTLSDIKAYIEICKSELYKVLENEKLPLPPPPPIPNNIKVKSPTEGYFPSENHRGVNLLLTELP